MNTSRRPLPPPPRRLGALLLARVAVRRAAASPLTWLGGILLLLAPPLAALFAAAALRDARLLRDGRPALATVVQKSFRRSGSGQGKTEATFRLTYAFPLPDGTIQEGRREVPRSRWELIFDDDQLPLRYDPLQPERHLLPGLDEGTRPVTAIVVPLLFAIAGAGLLYRFGRADIALTSPIDEPPIPPGAGRTTHVSPTLEVDNDRHSPS